MEIRCQDLRTPGFQQKLLSPPTLALPRGLKKKSSLNTKLPETTHEEFSEEGTAGCVQRGRTSGVSF